MKVVLVAGGEPDATDERWLDGADLIVAIDGGAGWLAARDRAPDALVGDLDSVDEALLRALQERSVDVERHPREKDSSDAALAIEYARLRRADEVLVVGAFGGPRVDHEIANVLMLSADSAPSPGEPPPYGWLSLVRGRSRVRCLRGGQRAALDADLGSTVSVFPVNGDARGVTTGGLRYALRDEDLPAGTTRGLSNVVDAPLSWVELRAGALLIVEELEGDRTT